MCRKRDLSRPIYNDILLKEAVIKSTSNRQVALKLKCDTKLVSRRIKELNLDINHFDKSSEKGSNKYLYLIGQQFGHLVIKDVYRNIKRSKRGIKFALCECTNCGNQKFETQMRSILGGRTKSCGCTRDHFKRNSESPCWKGYGEISKQTWNTIVRNSKIERHRRRTRVLKFTITIEFVWHLFLKQERKCAISGVKLDFPTINTERGTASLDRIDSTKGYVEGNVQWVHKRINLIKQYLSDRELIDWCEIVTNYQKSKTKVDQK